VLEGGDGSVRTGGRGAETGWCGGDAVAVTGPHRRGGAGLEPREQPCVLAHRDFGTSVFPLARGRDRTVSQVRHQHHAVADAQHRDAEIEQTRVRGGRPGIEHRAGPPGEDDALRSELPDEGHVRTA
jgi:hypothetical protein